MSTKSYNIFIEVGNEFKVNKNLVNSIHKQLLIKVKKQILNNIQPRQHVTPLPAIEAWELPSPEKETNYLFSGKRGSGKTTFMKTLIGLLLRKIDDGEELTNESSTPQRKIGFLCWHDPSESVGCEDYFFFSIMAALKSKLAEIIKERKKTDPDHSFLIDYCKTCMKHLDKGIVRLSHSRKAIDGMTPQKAAELRKDTPELDASIRQNFANLVEKICELSELDSLIVAIDDADIRSTQCYYVLEDLRLYIRHPRLIILMAGDKNMYIEHIREHLFLEYKNKYHKAEPIGKDARLQMVINHADQYLLKLFPLINQHELVNLQTLRSKEVRIDFYLSFQDYTKRVNGKDLPLTTQKNLRELLGRVFFLLISENEAEIEPFIETFFRLPLRSILQVLHFWSEHKVWHYLDELHNPGSRTIVTNDDRNYYRKEIIYVVKNSLKRILIEEANLKSFNYVWEYELDGHSYYSLLLHHYQHTSNLEQGCLLDGRIGRNNQTKFTTLLLAILFKSHVKTLYDFLSFILFGPATISLYTRFSTENSRQKIDSDSQEKRTLFDNYMQVGCGINAAEWSRRASIILSLTKQNAGVQQVNSRIHLEYIAAKLGDINTNSIPENFEQACQIFTILTLLSRTDPVENTYILSIYNYLGFIVQCLSICKTAKNSRLQIFNDLIESYFDIKYAPYPVQQLANTNKRNSINFDNFKKKKQSIRQALMALPDATDSSKLSLNTLQGINSVTCNEVFNSEEIFSFSNNSYTSSITNVEESDIANNASIIAFEKSRKKQLAKEILTWCDNCPNVDLHVLCSISPFVLGEFWNTFSSDLESILSTTDQRQQKPLFMFSRAITHTLKTLEQATNIETDEPHKANSLINTYLKHLHAFPLNIHLEKIAEYFMKAPIT